MVVVVVDIAVVDVVVADGVVVVVVGQVLELAALDFLALFVKARKVLLDRNAIAGQDLLQLAQSEAPAAGRLLRVLHHRRGVQGPKRRPQWWPSSI